MQKKKVFEMIKMQKTIDAGNNNSTIESES